MTLLLTLEELVRVAERTLGESPVLRDVGLLASAVARPGTSIEGQDAYPTLEAKAASLVHSVIRNHALVDGNKRLALAALLVTLGINGRTLTWSNDEAYSFIIAIVERDLDDVPSIAARIAQGIVDPGAIAGFSGAQ